MIAPKIKLHIYNDGNPQEVATLELPADFFLYEGSYLRNIIDGLCNQIECLQCCVTTCCEQAAEEIESVRDLAQQALDVANQALAIALENKAWIDSQPT